MDMLTWTEETLRTQFAPNALEVSDESAQHKGHMGWRAGQVTHLRVKISAPLFADKTRLERHRLINTALQPAFDAGLHALALEITTG
jgi:BolA family transcriptional regulator, general stress-responsive regulator